MTSASPRWKPALALFGTPARPRRFAEESLWPGRSGGLSAEFYLPPRPSLVVLSPKLAPPAWWRAGPLPPDIGVMYVPFPADPRSARVIRAALPRDVPVVFVGDLDPQAIVQYAAARSAWPGPLRRQLRFGGVSSAWLEGLWAALRPEFAFARIRMPLSTPEKRLLRLVEAATDLEMLVGKSAAALLRSGFKLEIEGATNPSLFVDADTPWVFELLRAAGRRGPGHERAR